MRGVAVSVMWSLVATMPVEAEPDPGMEALTLALGAVRENDFEAAARHFGTACGYQVHVACAYLAPLYRYGRGVDQDLGIASDYYRQACRGGVAVSCHEGGVLLVETQANSAAAAVEYQHGCDGGYYPSCAFLADLYAAGEGVERDEERAAQLYEQACAGGFEDACEPR